MMSTLQRRLRLVLTWLLAIVLPLQGLGTAVASTRGPLHVHVAVHASSAALLDVRLVNLRLVDLRRSFAAPSAALPVSIDEWQHLVGHLEPLRHHHAADASMVRSHEDAADHDEQAGSSAMPFIAILPATSDWRHATGCCAPRASAVWTPTTRSTAPPERPPRQG